MSLLTQRHSHSFGDSIFYIGYKSHKQHNTNFIRYLIYHFLIACSILHDIPSQVWFYVLAPVALLSGSNSSSHLGEAVEQIHR